MEGDKINIKAAERPGYQFVRWEVVPDNVTITGVNNKEATFIMPNENVELKARYNKLYTITVDGGHADVTSALTGKEITVDADVPDGKKFMGWKAEGITLTPAQQQSDHITFFMPEGKDPADYRDAVIKKLRKFIAIAEKHDVILMHENEKDIYGDVLSRCVDLMQTLNSAHFKSAFDFANFVQCGEDTAKCWDALRPYIVYIHIKDAVSTDKENVLCGTGEGKIPELLHKAIVEEGYTGFLTLEPHLVLFDSLQSLETTDAKNIIRENKYKNGAEGYAAQYHALCDILAKF